MEIRCLLNQVSFWRINRPHPRAVHGSCCGLQAPVQWQTRRCKSNTCVALLLADEKAVGLQAAGSQGGGVR